jgi:hypothetical protein
MSNNNNNLSSNLQRIIQQYLNQSPDHVRNPRQPPPRTRARESFSMSQILPMMERYHNIMEDYQNMFRLVILMASLEQTSQQLQQQQQQQQQQQPHIPQTRPPVFDYSNIRAASADRPMETAQRHPTPTEPGEETQQQQPQTVSFVDVVVEIDEPLETTGNSETNLQNYISNMFQSESFRNNLFQNTGLTSNTMQWYTSFSNANNRQANRNQMEEEESGLSNEQIENCTRRITYRDNNHTELLSHTCPITMEDFREGDVLLQLTDCSHAFREMDLLRWFVTHSTCPVCRRSYRNFPLND